MINKNHDHSTLAFSTWQGHSSQVLRELNNDPITQSINTSKTNIWEWLSSLVTSSEDHKHFGHGDMPLKGTYFLFHLSCGISCFLVYHLLLTMVCCTDPSLKPKQKTDLRWETETVTPNELDSFVTWLYQLLHLKQKKEKEMGKFI